MNEIRLIDANALKEAIRYPNDKRYLSESIISLVFERIDNAPTVEPDISKLDCEGCKYEDKKGSDYPCFACKNNHVNMFEWKDEKSG